MASAGAGFDGRDSREEPSPLHRPLSEEKTFRADYGHAMKGLPSHHPKDLGKLNRSTGVLEKSGVFWYGASIVLEACCRAESSAESAAPELFLEIRAESSVASSCRFL